MFETHFNNVTHNYLTILPKELIAINLIIDANYNYLECNHIKNDIKQNVDNILCTDQYGLFIYISISFNINF